MYKIVLSPDFLIQCDKYKLLDDPHGPQNKQGFVDTLQVAVNHLREGTPLPRGYDDHAMKNEPKSRYLFKHEYQGKTGQPREFHLRGADIVVVYIKYDDEIKVVKLMKTGTHKDMLHCSAE